MTEIHACLHTEQAGRWVSDDRQQSVGKLRQNKLTDGNLLHVRHKVVGDAIRIFSYLSTDTVIDTQAAEREGVSTGISL